MPTTHSSLRPDRGLGTAGTGSHPASNRLECMFHPASARYGQMPSPARVIAADRKRIHSTSERTGALYPSRIAVSSGQKASLDHVQHMEREQDASKDPSYCVSADGKHLLVIACYIGGGERIEGRSYGKRERKILRDMWHAPFRDREPAGTNRHPLMVVVRPDRFVREKCSDTPSPCVSPDPQGSCAVPFVSADRAAEAAKQRCRDGQEPALVRRIGASGCQAPPQNANWADIARCT